MKFKGTIVITDPCYIMREGEHHVPDWDTCDCGYRMERLGFHTGNYHVEQTGVGDGCWCVRDIHAYKLGEVSADSGLTGVFLLDEVLKYNPDFLNMKYLNILATIIEDFDGDIEFTYQKRKYSEPLLIKGTGTSKGRLIGFHCNYGGWKEDGD